MEKFTVKIDSREQTPWSFPGDVKTTIGKIDAGDYAIDGDNRFAIERKSVDDFAGTIATGWARFNRELKRMDDSDFAAKVIVVEGTLSRFCYNGQGKTIFPPEHNHVMLTPAFIFKRIAQLTLKNVAVIFADDAELASAMGLKILKERWEQIQNENHC